MNPIEVRELALEEHETPEEAVANAILRLRAEASPRAVSQRTGIPLEEVESMMASDRFWGVYHRQAQAHFYGPEHQVLSMRAILARSHGEILRQLHGTNARGADGRGRNIYKLAKLGVDVPKGVEASLGVEMKLQEYHKSRGGEVDPSVIDVELETMEGEAGRFWLEAKAKEGDEAALALLQRGGVTGGEIAKMMRPALEEPTAADRGDADDDAERMTTLDGHLPDAEE